MASTLDDAHFRDLVGECAAQTSVGLYGTWLRGVRFPEGAQPTRADMGLPPPELCEPGRFHRAGEQAMYAARTLEAVEAEVPPRRGRTMLFVQRYDVDLPDARVFRRPRRGQLAWVWSQADQRATVDEDYRLSHLLADVMRAAGVDAVLYDSDESVGNGPQNLALFGAAAHQAEALAVGEPAPLA